MPAKEIIANDKCHEYVLIISSILNSVTSSFYKIDIIRFVGLYNRYVKKPGSCKKGIPALSFYLQSHLPSTPHVVQPPFDFFLIRINITGMTTAAIMNTHFRSTKMEDNPIAEAPVIIRGRQHIAHAPIIPKPANQPFLLMSIFLPN
jgi:hypothetical protein